MMALSCVELTFITMMMIMTIKMMMQQLASVMRCRSEMKRRQCTGGGGGGDGGGGGVLYTANHSTFSHSYRLTSLARQTASQPAS